MMIQALRQQGAPYSTSDGEIGLFNDTAKEFLFEIAAHTENGEFSTFKISSYPGNFLNAGQCIFAIDSTAGATWMGYGSPQGDIHSDKVVEFETAVMAIPQFDTNNPTMISQGPSVCVFNKPDSGEVLASWLFVQYLLTNDVQIAYSQTEGYVPVTSKAQNDPVYVDYLSREGEDKELYYDVKLKATKLALEYTDKSFVTPVFNGSASLRNAAGQLIEEVTKAIRRHKTVDDAFIENLYVEMISLHRLDGIGAGSGAKAELGPMPPTGIALLSSIGAAWVFIGIYVLVGYIKKRKNQGNT
jgi:multiple sugar transport system substrate-binding protein